MNETLGKIAYEAYCAKTGWKSLISGVPLPQWGVLRVDLQEAWEAAADAVAAQIKSETGRG